MVHTTSLIHIFCGVWTLASFFANNFYMMPRPGNIDSLKNSLSVEKWLMNWKRRERSKEDIKGKLWRLWRRWKPYSMNLNLLRRINWKLTGLLYRKNSMSLEPERRNSGFNDRGAHRRGNWKLQKIYSSNDSGYWRNSQRSWTGEGRE